MKLYFTHSFYQTCSLNSIDGIWYNRERQGVILDNMDKLKRIFSKVPKKHHVEFITALLSIPVLLTVIALNWSSLNANKKGETEKPREIIISLPVDKNPTAMPTKPECKEGIGTITIASPGEGDTVSINPVSVTIVYKPGDFCAAVWSYRTNGGSWSDYDDKSIALYNLPFGSIDLDLRVKSIVSGGEEKTLRRSFTYKSTTPTVTSTPTPSNTPTPTQGTTPTVTQ